MRAHRRQFFNLLTLQLMAGMLGMQASTARAADLTAAYDWKPLRIGGGGWVVGMWVHPTASNLVFCRTDVSGAYRWNETTKTWTRIVTDQSMPTSATAYATYAGVDSIVGAPSDPARVYMTYRGAVYKSTNTGETWSLASSGFTATMNANGEGRTLGERLQVDPANKDVVYYGSINSGLWYTHNGGASWARVPLASVPAGTDTQFGISTVEFNAAGGTNAQGRTQHIYVTPWGAGVYRSTDAGASWSKISGGSGPADSVRVTDAEVDANGNYYIVAGNDLWRYTAGVWTRVWQAGSTLDDMAIDPFNPARIIVIRAGGTAYRSTNAGATWSSALSPVILTNSDAPYLVAYHSPVAKWISVGELAFDTTVPGRLWLSEGFGMAQSTALSNAATLPWTFYNTGIEEVCGNDIIAPPGGKPVGAGWDLSGFRFDDADQNRDRQMLSNIFGASWSLDWMGSNPSNLVVLNCCEYNWSALGNLSGYSTNGGITWTLFNSRPLPTNELFYYGVIAVSASNLNNIVWVPANTRGPNYTKDRGTTWHVSSNAVSPSWINQTLYRKHLTADKVLDGVFYLYNPNHDAIYRSNDGGVTWQRIATAPFYYRYNPVLKAVPGHAGHLWMAEGKEDAVVGPLWRSVNGGVTWVRVTNGLLQQAFNVGFGKPAPGKSYPTLFVAGVVNSVRGIYRSTDQGMSWDRICVNPLGVWDCIDAMDGDKDVFGRVYVAFSGSGFAYGMIKPLQITSTNLPAAQVSVPYTQQLVATGGTPPYAWSIASGALPGGLTLATNGLLSGTATAVTTARCSVVVTDCGEGHAVHELVLYVIPEPAGAALAAVLLRAAAVAARVEKQH